jgi:hypothetical protein
MVHGLTEPGMRSTPQFKTAGHRERPPGIKMRCLVQTKVAGSTFASMGQIVIMRPGVQARQSENLVTSYEAAWWTVHALKLQWFCDYIKSGSLNGHTV